MTTRLRPILPYIVLFLFSLVMLVVQLVRNHRLNNAASIGSAWEGSVDHQKAMSVWKTYPYAPINDRAAIISQIKQAHVTLHADISASMHENLARDAADLIGIFQSSTPGTAFATYVSAQNPKRLCVSESEIRGIAAQGSVASTGPILNVISAIYNKARSKPLFSGMSGKASEVTYMTVNRNSEPYREIAQTDQDVNRNLPASLGHRTFNKLYEFPGDFHEQYDSGVNVMICELRIYVKDADTDQPERVVTRLVWCARSQKWLPFELVTDDDNPKEYLLLP